MTGPTQDGSNYNAVAKRDRTAGDHKRDSLDDIIEISRDILHLISGSTVKRDSITGNPREKMTDGLKKRASIDDFIALIDELKPAIPPIMADLEGPGGKDDGFDKRNWVDDVLLVIHALNRPLVLTPVIG